MSYVCPKCKQWKDGFDVPALVSAIETIQVQNILDGSWGLDDQALGDSYWDGDDPPMKCLVCLHQALASNFEAAWTAFLASHLALAVDLLQEADAQLGTLAEDNAANGIDDDYIDDLRQRIDLFHLEIQPKQEDNDG